jgi:3-methyladenine DNA glycosylase AlkC
MPEPLKNIYNPCFFEAFTGTLNEVIPGFKKQQFVNTVFNIEWPDKELKQRIKHIAISLKEQLPGDYKDNIKAITKVIEALKAKGVKENNFEYIFFPEFIAIYGLHDLETSLKAMEVVTQFSSCEFAVRPFLLQYPDEVMHQMLLWSKHPHPSVRRLSSEGCRPRLPWGLGIPQFKKDPSPILPILDNLKNDTSLFVRKSVANNINDIAKDNPSIAIQLVRDWKGVSAETDWIIKHGCRSLLKKADKNAYQLFGLSSSLPKMVKKLSLSASKINIGDQLQYSFILSPATTLKLRVECAVYYNKANDKQNKKIFKLSEQTYEAGKNYRFDRTHRFQHFTTRRQYAGKHKIGIVINGQEQVSKEFVVV